MVGTVEARPHRLRASRLACRVVQMSWYHTNETLGGGLVNANPFWTLVQRRARGTVLIPQARALAFTGESFSRRFDSSGCLLFPLPRRSGEPRKARPPGLWCHNRCGLPCLARDALPAGTVIWLCRGVHGDTQGALRRVCVCLRSNGLRSKAAPGGRAY